MTTINCVGNALSGAAGTGSFAGATSFTPWTPSFTFATPGNLSVSYATQTGSYEITGNIYTIVFNLVCTPTFTTSSGVAQITGIPVASNATAGNIAVGNAYINNINWGTSYTSIALQILAGASVINIVSSGSTLAASTLAATNFTSGTAISVNGTLTYLI